MQAILKLYVLQILQEVSIYDTYLFQLVHKVSNGQSVEEAVEDIIIRGVSELRKNAFGEDAEDAKSLAWSREQAWAIIRALARRDEVCSPTKQCVRLTDISRRLRIMTFFWISPSKAMNHR